MTNDPVLCHEKLIKNIFVIISSFVYRLFKMAVIENH